MNEYMNIFKETWDEAEYQDQGKEIIWVEPQEHCLCVCTSDENYLEVRQIMLDLCPKGKVNTCWA